MLGASSTGFTVIVTVAVDVSPFASVIVYWNVSTPLKSGRGEYRMYAVVKLLLNDTLLSLVAQLMQSTRFTRKWSTLRVGSRTNWPEAPL